MKKNILIGILLLFIILLASYPFHLWKENRKFVTDIKEQDARFVKNADVSCGGGLEPGLYTLGNNGCYFEYALQNESYGVCNKINDSFRFDCLRMVADLKGDVLGCEKITPFDETQTLEDMKLGAGYNDVSASTQKEWCYTDLSFKNKDTKICKKITTPEAKNKCQKCAAGLEQDSFCYPINRIPQHL